jgi:uncharacterized OB-fold protein
MTSQQTRPVPDPDELTAPYWDAAREHRLAIQRCSGCGHYQHPPRVYCTACAEGELGFEDVSGAATVYSYSRVVETSTPGMAAPYTVLIAELAEQRGLWILSDCDAVHDVHVGDPLHLEFEEIGEGFVLPQFRPVVSGAAR